MPWASNGVTNKRRLIDQSATVAWGNTTVRVPTRALTQVGYLRGMRVKIPIQAGTLTVTAGHPLAVPAAAQRPAFRAVNAFDITAQGITPFYQLSKGQDLAFLQYVNNGKPRYRDVGLGLAPDIAPASPLGALGRPAASLAAMAYHLAAAAISGTSQNVQVSAVYDVPLVETVRMPEYTVQTQNGTQTVPAQSIEVGMITLQNTQQNITPHLVLNPLWSQTIDSPFTSDATPPTGNMSTLIEFYTEFYDVPSGAGNQPPAYSQLFIVTRQSTDDGTAGGTVTHTFQPAGLLLRAIYTFYDVNDNLVDFSTQSIQAVGTYALPAQVPEGVISFAWGSTVYKSTERFSLNLAEAFELYGEPPPPGCLIHDFFRDHTLTDVINTAVLPSVRAAINGLPAAVTNCHTIEERMIPVKMS